MLCLAVVTQNFPANTIENFIMKGGDECQMLDETKKVLKKYKRAVVTRKHQLPKKKATKKKAE